MGNAKNRINAGSESDLADILVSDEDNKALTVPEFCKEWEAEFLEANILSQRIRASNILSLPYFMCLFTVFYFETSQNGRINFQNITWWSNLPNLIGWLSNIFFALFLGRSTPHPFFTKYYKTICSMKTLFFMLLFIIPSSLLEKARYSSEWDSADHVQITFDYTSIFPERNCSDNKPVLSWTVLNVSLGGSSSVGCDDVILSGELCCGYILLNLLPIIFRVGFGFALFNALTNTSILAFAVLISGTRNWATLTLVVLESLSGIIAACVCRTQTAESRRSFALAKGMRRAAEQNRNLLYTLIPRNVVEHLAAHTFSDEMPGTDIADCTVMFCSIEPQELLRSSFSTDVFDLMNDVFSDFDMAVHRSGMFKYQHVGEWYIVACPRAAKAFDPVEQAAPYPTEYTVSMAQLADELQTIARRYTVSEAPLWLRVGINRGPIAGAVIGRHRAFYTLYGDTVNTAARMCKYAGVAVHCTATFRDAVEAAGVDFLRCESRGEREVKGKGWMETFELHVDSDMADSGPAFLSPALRVGAAGKTRRAFAWASGRGAALSRVFSLRGELVEACEANGAAAQGQPVPEDGAPAACQPGDLQRGTLASPALERGFLSSTAGARSLRLAGALALRMVAVACQWHVVVQPEFDYDFSALGRPDLDEAKAAARDILTAHLAVAAALTAVGFGLCAVRWTGWAQALFAASKAAHVAASMAAARRLPAAWGWLACFSAQVACLDGLLGALPFRAAAALNIAAFAALAAVVPTLPVLAAGAVARQITFALLLCVGSALFSWAADVEERRRWLLGFRFRAELRKLRRMLFDLLPAKIAGRMLEAGGRIPCEPCVAVVLQLDICRFTELSQTMAPMEVARMLHEVFSAFDAAVLERGLFKVRFTCEAAYH